MNYKKSNAEHTTVTRNLSDLDRDTQNIYESIIILAKRANQINSVMREELSSKLEEFATTTDNLEEIFENREQIEISRFYERLPKPSQIATQELLDGKIYFRRPELEEKPAIDSQAAE